ncbi:MAG: DUF3850 domain-containing protein [Candidatus Dojkabacteria bacterium]
MRRIEKKTWPYLFEKMLSGEKKFEVRLADFDCEEGDVLVLREWDPETKEYTGREVEKEVGYVFKTKDTTKFWSKEELEKYGLYIITIKE